MRRRFIAPIVVISAVGILLVIVLRKPHPKISARELLQEASRQGSPLEQIFYQQARQGYYSDALKTAYQSASADPRNYKHDLSGLIVELVKARAENGDIRGAKEMASRLQPELGSDRIHATRSIAFVQVANGDLSGALQTVAGIGAANDVLTWYGDLQIAKGDFDGALATSEKVNEGSAYDLFYEVGDALRQRKQQQRLRVLASHMKDRKRAAEFVEAARVTLWDQPPVRIIAGPCVIAWEDALHGQFNKADGLIKANNCGYTGVGVLVKQYASDPRGAEHQLAIISFTKDQRVAGLAKISEAAAKKGDVQDALRLADDCERLSDNSFFCLDCIQKIAWAWTQKGKPDLVLRWARSRPTAAERGYALLGIAQALAHPRPTILYPQITAGVEP